MPEKQRPPIVSTYSYRDEGGAHLFDVLRYKPKGFRQRRPNPGGGWTWSLDGVRRVIFRLDVLHQSRPDLVFVVEGEKDVLSLEAAGLAATCNSGGAGKWTAEHARQLAATGAHHVRVVPDDDDPGRLHAEKVAATCRDEGLEVRIVTLPKQHPGADVSDFLAAGGTRDHLLELAREAAGSAADDGRRNESTIDEVDKGEQVDALVDGVRFNASILPVKNQVVRVVMTVYDDDRVVMVDNVNLTSERSRKNLITKVRQAIARPWDLVGDPLLALEQEIRSTSTRKAIERSNTPPQVELTERVEALLKDSNVLERVSNALQAVGWVGDVRPPLIAYVAMTSRLLTVGSQINVAFVSPAASGKSAAVDAARALIPVDGCHLERAGSERALIYTETSFQHKTVIFAESDSIPEDGPAASAIRSLASDNVMEYDTVEKNAETGRLETRRISKPGPTCLITTGTKSLQNQLGTRVLEVTLRDDPHQTRLIVQAQAAAASGATPRHFDPTDFVAAQTWLAAGAPYRVVVPYAVTLGALVPSSAARMRRDFPKLLACIGAIALLHVLQRPRTPDGAIIATLDDYASARDLLSVVFDGIVSDGLTIGLRQTVSAIAAGEEVTQAELCSRLGLSKAAVSWRVNKALRGGWLRNEETRRYQPARLVRGASMVEARPSLPSVETVRYTFESDSQPQVVEQAMGYGASFERSNGSASENDGDPQGAQSPIPIQSTSSPPDEADVFEVP